MNFKDKFIDLHIHSTVSDGTWTPGEIAEVIDKSGVGIYSITDHDDVCGVLEGETFAIQNNLNYIRGVEVSSTLDKDWEHILAYGIDINDKSFNSLLKENRERIIKKDAYSIEHLEKIGYQVSAKEFADYKYDKRRGGFKALNYLVDKGLCTDVYDFFNRFKEIEEVTQFPIYRSVNEVVDIIKAAGGIPVIAHPFYNIDEIEDVHGRLKRFLNLGIEGIECYHPSHNLQVANECMDFCKRNNLVMTVGSDCHGTFAPSRKIGMHSIRVSDISIGKLQEHIL